MGKLLAGTWGWGKGSCEQTEELLGARESPQVGLSFSCQP